MTSELALEHLREEGREVGADVRLACWTEDGPDGSGAYGITPRMAQLPR
jgi:hypothetical protein